MSAPVALSVERLHHGSGRGPRTFRVVVSVGADLYKVRLMAKVGGPALLLGCETKNGKRPSDDRYMPVCYAAIDAVRL